MRVFPIRASRQASYHGALNNGVLLLALVGDLRDDDGLPGAHDVDGKVDLDVERAVAFLGAHVVDVVQAFAFKPVEKVDTAFTFFYFQGRTI